MTRKEEMIRGLTRVIRAEYRAMQDHVRIERHLALAFQGTRHAAYARNGYREALAAARKERWDVAACGAGLGLEV
jgi:hypothetical protein